MREAVDTVLIEPVPYQKVAGTGFYHQFIDTAEWPAFMRAGRTTMLDTLRRMGLTDGEAGLAVPGRGSHRPRPPGC